jgi:hypothetical protein
MASDKVTITPNKADILWSGAYPEWVCFGFMVLLDEKHARQEKTSQLLVLLATSHYGEKVTTHSGIRYT